MGLADELQKIIEKNSSKAEQETIEFIIKESEPYIPYKTGNLNASVSPSASAIEVSAPYAEYALNPISSSGKPKVYDTSVHQKAQGNPFEASIQDNEQKIAEFYVEALFKDE